MLVVPNLQVRWWTVAEAVVWVASKGEAHFAADFDLTERLFKDAEPDAWWKSFGDIWEGCEEGKLDAWGSIDGAIEAQIPNIVWSNFTFIAWWNDSPIWGIRSPGDFIFSSVANYPAEAVVDRSEPNVTNLQTGGSTTRYHRVISNLKINRDNILSRWPAGNSALTADKKNTSLSRTKRELAISVDDIMSQMTIKGYDVSRHRGNNSISHVARQVHKQLIDQNVDVKFETVYQAVRRRYDDISRSF